MSMAVSSRRLAQPEEDIARVLHVIWSGSKCSMVVAIAPAWPDGGLGFSAAGGVGISGLGDGACSVAPGAGGC